MDTRHLGKASALPASPEEAVLDYVPNPRPGTLYLVRFAALSLQGVMRWHLPGVDFAGHSGHVERIQDDVLRACEGITPGRRSR